MITYRVATKVNNEPPVRFYRTIAITFLVVTFILLAVVLFFTSKKAQIVIVAKSDSKNINFTVDISKEKTSSSVAGNASSVSIFKTNQYFPTGNKRVSGIATGEVILINETNASQTLVKTTRLLTVSGTLFRLSDNVTIPANGQIITKMYADKEGAEGDIGPAKFTIPGLNADKQKVIYASSTISTAGGFKTVGILTDNDIKTAETDFLDKVKQQALAASASSTVEKELAVVTDYKVNADRKAGDEVSEFNLSGTSTVALITYNYDDLRALVEKEINNKIDITTEKVLSLTKEPQVSLLKYDVANGTGQLSVNQDVLVTLDANADKLAPNNFYNQTKDQIERYALGLGHVVGVEVKFTPSWIRTAPAVSDRIQVIVKNFE